MLDVTETKKRLRDFVNRLSADFGDYNHLSQFNRKMDEAEKILEYIEAKIILRNEKAHEAVTQVSTKKKEKADGNDAATDGTDAEADSSGDAGSGKTGKPA
jgi:hypothetical protein